MSSDPYFTDDTVTLYAGDCLDVLRGLPDCSVHAIVTDPPYGLGDPNPALIVKTLERWFAGDREHVPDGRGFMGKAWDAFVPPPAVWDECLRVLRPGGHLLAFAGSRTVDLMTLSVRLAGFETRDCLAWLYGSGFPKSLDVGKAIDKAAGADREIVGQRDRYRDGVTRQNLGDHNEVYGRGLTANGVADITAPTTDAAKQWDGWGTALKPAFEPIVVGRKPLAGKTVAANVQEYGTGGLNIDACRIPADAKLLEWSQRYGNGDGYAEGGEFLGGKLSGKTGSTPDAGRWPANVVLDEYTAGELDKQSGTLTSGANPTRRGADGARQAYGEFNGQTECTPARGVDSGGASRFFYTAKAGKGERPQVDGAGHPTVKPVALMQWLVRLVTPPGGVVLDPFLGSGTTAEACIVENFRCIGIERDEHHLRLITARLSKPIAPTLFGI